MKTVTIRITKAGGKVTRFDIYDDRGNLLLSDVTKAALIDGVSVEVDESVKTIVLVPVGKGCCDIQAYNIPVTKMSRQMTAMIVFEPKNTASLWRHLTNTTIYNTYYGCIEPYIIEYPFAYQYHDEILQNVKDYTKAYKYLPSIQGVFDDTRKVATDSEWFNKAVLYNDQQSSGILKLVPKPMNNLKDYLKYPIYSTDSKTITFTKSDSFYQYNTFWSLVRDKKVPLFTNTCETLSIDKVVNQTNMDYGKRSFKKEPLRAKYLKVRHILDDRSDVHLTSQFIYAPAQISYK